MKQTVHFEDFRKAFQDIRPNQFTNDGSKTLYENLIEYEDSTGEELDLDVIAICCDYTEFKSLKDFQNNYNNIYKSIEDIEDTTMVMQIPDSSGFIVQNF